MREAELMFCSRQFKAQVLPLSAAEMVAALLHADM